MTANFSAIPGPSSQIKTYVANFKDVVGFPLLIIGLNSYIVSSEIESGIDLDKKRIAHNIQVGKFCSLADKIKFMIGLNHDYKSIATGECKFLEGVSRVSRIHQKCQIIIQNDVWIGSGTTVMGGVTIHNGAVVAANSHVVKDVPPYAIAGGNPAKIIKYRFEKEQIEKLLKISWWDWTDDKLLANKMFFSKPVDEFIDEFYENSLHENIPAIHYKKEKPVYLFFPDLDENFPVIDHVIRSYNEYYGQNKNAVLFMYLQTNDKTNETTDKIHCILEENKCVQNANIIIHIDGLNNEKSAFKIADYYITSRSSKTVLRTCLADEFGVKIVSGVDNPIFN